MRVDVVARDKDDLYSLVEVISFVAVDFKVVCVPIKTVHTLLWVILDQLNRVCRLWWNWCKLVPIFFFTLVIRNEPFKFDSVFATEYPDQVLDVSRIVFQLAWVVTNNGESDSKVNFIQIKSLFLCVDLSLNDLRDVRVWMTHQLD